MIPTYAVIPTHDRLGMLVDTVKSIADQVDLVFIIDNNEEERLHLAGLKLRTWDATTLDPNIQRFWNRGLHLSQQCATVRGHKEWNVVILNDDVVCPSDFVATLGVAMRATSAVLAYPSQFGHERSELHTEPGPVDMTTRITGYAYMLRGESGIALDERFVWWYGDDDLDWRAREMGGSLMVPNCPVIHRAPNAQTNANPKLLKQTALDRQTFINKWGRVPH